MKRVSLLAFAFALPLFTALPAMAESCEEPCPEGKVLVSFADGNNVDCICADPGAAMNDTTTENPEGDGSGPEPGPDA